MLRLNDKLNIKIKLLQTYLIGSVMFPVENSKKKSFSPSSII